VNAVVANDLAELKRLNRIVAEFWAEHSLPSDLESDVTLALEEIVVNIIRYGFPEGGKHEILIRLSLEDGAVAVAVEDQGVPFNPLEAPPPDLESPLEKRRIGGLGIHIVKSIVDAVDYRREAGRNCLTLRKLVGSAG
jgi:anti-sigma regulatory factor (Ser/Thr protein kinase)